VDFLWKTWGRLVGCSHMFPFRSLELASMSDSAQICGNRSSASAAIVVEERSGRSRQIERPFPLSAAVGRRLVMDMEK
jgi:hypothetical protein